MNQNFFDPTQVWSQFANAFAEAARPPQSFDQLRREWLKSLKSEELWSLHDDVIDEIKSR